MKGTESVWKESHVIESYEADVKGLAKPHVLFAFMLNSAWNHANSTGYGYRGLSGRGQFWALSKFFLIIRQFPKWNERVVIETWGKGLDRFLALRDFIIHSSENEKLASATSSWVILDRETYRPQRLDRMREEFPWEVGRNELDFRPEKIRPLSNERVRSRFPVRYTDLDVNRHVTASKYMQWMLDSYPVEVLEESDLNSIEINFLTEAKMNDEVWVSAECLDGHDLCNIRRAADMKELCRARIEWRARQDQSRDQRKAGCP